MEKSSTDVNTDDEIKHTPECVAENEKFTSIDIEELGKAVKKLVIDETKNTVQEAPKAPQETVQLKPDTPKIAVKQFDHKFLLVDSFTDSTIGLYPSNKVANTIMIELVRKDILLYIDMYQKKILIGESVEENRDSLAVIRNLLYQYRTIEQSMNTSIMLENKAISRYRIMCLKVDDREVDESNYFNF
jgi:hypothetical protein